MTPFHMALIVFGIEAVVFIAAAVIMGAQERSKQERMELRQSARNWREE